MSLLREGASVNAAAAMVNSCGDLQVLYPLQAAMQTDNWVILQYLLDQGADANMPACLGCCGVMDYALSLGSARDLGLLVNAGGRLHEPEDHSPDWIISAFESTERCPIFLEPDRARVLLDQLDTDITLPGYDGTTLLDLTDWDSELDVHADWYQSAESEEKFRRTAQMVVDEVLWSICQCNRDVHSSEGDGDIMALELGAPSSRAPSHLAIKSLAPSLLAGFELPGWFRRNLNLLQRLTMTSS